MTERQGVREGEKSEKRGMIEGQGVREGKKRENRREGMRQGDGGDREIEMQTDTSLFSLVFVCFYCCNFLLRLIYC